ncbi:class I SAM-dependent methyltransferase [Teredinibacter haidensis]|uniref:class I SAM-dependent methyltransferase n=1 Tax=Teredinibacter haidensis TaxID=2731755 RepID=UPI000948F146|nr:class I SAM-dependent methyltransferase [Teredinibacter haidensis]
MKMKLLIALSLSAAMLCSAPVFADGHVALKVKLQAAMADKNRPEKHVQRDANRKPLETLSFFGLKDDMSVVELVPGGGWYTRILAPTLREKGKLYVAYGANWMGDLLQQPGFENVTLLAAESKLYKPDGERFYKLENIASKATNVDMVLTFRNYHNFDETSRKLLNDEVYRMLKVGGIYGVVDHTRRHMEPLNGENGRRFDPVLAIKEIQAAGFELVDYSELHYKPVDELKYEVGNKNVTGRTDRFTLKFKKVQK